MLKSRLTINILLSKSAIIKGSITKPTARSDTARLASKIFATECKEEVFRISKQRCEGKKGIQNTDYDQVSGSLFKVSTLF